MKLFVVATPIGNLGDLTQRAREILCSVPLVFAEDTRVAAKLLAHIGATPRVIALHHHTAGAALQNVIAEIERAGEAALVTDAGTPGISDPGNQFVETLLAHHPDVMISPIPGASSVTAALSICGFPTDRFRVLGFAPHKNKRNKYFDEVAATEETVVIFESVHRIKKTLEDLARVAPTRPLVVARELTKIYETVYRGTAAQMSAQITEGQTKGEFIIIIRAQ
ncbi:MAG: 16S rRNA (cytidine(1402)-2'-O)-methyltransferase [Candidatus Magasanikbacteria bacterium]|nr:16S rRNA (cytidine(1402)-2'-O)-methyltransferase [Candidatus Magasanikbacteria bacterium]